MTAISSRVLADAEIHFRRLTFDERVKLADEVHARQPNLFFSVLALQLQEATLEQMEVVLNILLVYYTAMRLSGHKWPVISEDDQERCLKRVTGRVRFLDGLTTAQQQSQSLTMPSRNIPKSLCSPTCTARSGNTATWASTPRLRK